MPCCQVATNVPAEHAGLDTLADSLSPKIAVALGKSEDYVQIVLQPGLTMRFGGSAEPTAFVKLVSLGLPIEKANPLSALICAEVEAYLSVPPNRVFVEFVNAERELFGWNGKTFG